MITIGVESFQSSAVLDFRCLKNIWFKAWKFRDKNLIRNMLCIGADSICWRYFAYFAEFTLSHVQNSWKIQQWKPQVLSKFNSFLLATTYFNVLFYLRYSGRRILRDSWPDVLIGHGVPRPTWNILASLPVYRYKWKIAVPKMWLNCQELSSLLQN